MTDKAVLISINAEWCDLIIQGIKTVEVRKSYPKKLECNFKCYVYCTKASPPIVINGASVNGKVIGEFTCDKIECFDSAFDEWARATAPSGVDFPVEIDSMGWNRFLDIIHNEARITDEQLNDYFPEDVEAYLWNITDFKLYDRLKEVSDFGLKKAPQSWCYVGGQS